MKVLKTFILAVIVLPMAAAPVLAQGTSGASEHGPSVSVFSGQSIGAGLGAGVTILGAGWGLGRIGAAAMESMARQPEISARIQTGMVVIAALLEGVTFFALAVCILIALGISPKW
jgi:F-type H+-transporting ATPase subunit c